MSAYGPATTSSLDAVRVSGGGGDRHVRMVRLVEATTRLRTVDARIGEVAARLCAACVVHDLSWRDLGRRLDRDRETARDWTVVALQAMAVAWCETAPPQRR
jgi:hypothetical protein